MKNQFSKSIILIALFGSTAWFGCKKDDTTTTPANTAPTGVTTSAAFNITSDGAQIPAIVGGTGGAAISARGVAYSKTNTLPTISDATAVNNETVVGSFTVTLNGLEKSTQYFARAYALNSVGVAYGSVQTFTTTAGANPSIKSMVEGSWKLTGYLRDGMDKFSTLNPCDVDDVWEFKTDGTLTLHLSAVKCSASEPDSFDDHWSLAADNIINLFGLNHTNMTVNATTLKFDYKGSDNVLVTRTFTKQ